MSCDEIVPGVYLGAYDVFFSKKFEELGVTHVISVAREIETPLSDRITSSCTTYRFPISGKMECNESIVVIKKVAKLLNELLSDNTNVIYLHCYEGVSRSAACLIYYIHKYCDIKGEEAISFVKSKRNSVNPNDKMTECLQVLLK
jgi:hypothetical protein